MNMTATTRQIGSVTIVDISGRIVLGEESAALRVLVCNLLDKGHRQILFNLGDVNYIDSAGLGSLVGAFTSVRKQKGELKLLNLTNKVHDVMQITKLYTVFDIMNDETEGVRSFGQRHDRRAGLEPIAHERDDLMLATAVQTANICFRALRKDCSTFPICTKTHAPTRLRLRNELRDALCRDCQRCIS